MRILHVGKYYAPERGGIERYTQALAEWCAARGDAVAALVHQRPGTWRSRHELVGTIDVRRVGCLAAPVYTPLSPMFPFELARALHDFRPDLLHLHLPNPSCFAALASPAARRLPWIVHWHADVPPDSPDWRLRNAYRVYRPFEQTVLARAAVIVATSHPYLEASAALRPWRAKTIVVPLGIAPCPTHAVPRTGLWRADSKLRLLAVGRLSRYKGLDVLIQAIARVADAALLLVGRGECERELRARIAAQHLESRVTMTGELDDDALESAYAAADAFVLPSLDRGEAFGLVLLEAMRARLPVIASAIPGSGVGEVVSDGETGTLVPPGDAAALAAAIERFRDPALRARLAAAGFERWQRMYTLDRSAHTIHTLYEDVLSRAGY
ncbi:MAG: glycosyltransferase [Rhodanobacter sp.]|jgi:glycosyltransferase involved in cell wall biosynthesis|nr:glycosyltransferase [Rhodanobacter sp.]